MAYYNYKRVRDSIPREFWDKFEKEWKEETGNEFECSADYDGDLWVMAAEYIESLQKEIQLLKAGK